MDYIRLGKSDLLISHVAFGAMRLSDESGAEDSAKIVRKAYDAGINFFDTSSKTPNSEKLLGDALYDIRRNVFIATTTSAKSATGILEDIETSLMNLHCDTIDLYQFETEKFLPVPNAADKIYDTLLNLKRQSKINHLGIVTTNPETAIKAIQSKLYETIQFPFNLLCYEQTEEIIKLCEEYDVGFIAMQPLGGGVVDNIPLAVGFYHQYENIVPIWGAKTLEEMEQILYFNEHPPVIDEKFKEDLEKVRLFFN